MAMDNTTEPAVRAARVAMRAAMLTFVTSTLPPLAATLDAAVQAADPTYPSHGADAEGAFFMACRQYQRTLRDSGATAVALMPLRP